MSRALKITGWLLMMMLASLIALVSLRFFFLRPEVASGPPLGEHFAARLPLLLAHVSGGVLALVLGPWQFWAGLRDRALRAHRWVGRVYLCAILLGGVAGLALAVMAFGGLATQTGFGGLALGWLVTGVMAYVRVRQGDFEAHREWMIRNYALTFAAVTLRLWLPLMTVAGLPFITAYTIVAWLSWVPNLLTAELYLKLKRSRAVLARGYAV